MISVIALANI